MLPLCIEEDGKIIYFLKNKNIFKVIFIIVATTCFPCFLLLNTLVNHIASFLLFVKVSYAIYLDSTLM